MIYRSLAGLDVSALALGTANFGGVGSSRKLVGMGEAEAEAHALLDCALELGINLIDTAGSYGDGASEAMIGSWISSRGAAIRDKVLISSKVGIRGGLARANVLREIERTLARLRVGWIDMYLTHLPDPATPWDDVLATMRDLMREGKIRAFGLSNISRSDVDACARAARDGGRRFEWVQNRFNLLDQEDARNGVIEGCHGHGMKYTCYSPLAGGLLSGKYVYSDAIPSGTRLALRPDMYAHAWTAANASRIEAMKSVAAENKMSLAGLATWWLVNCEFVTSVMIGPRQPRQLECLVLDALGRPDDRELSEMLATINAGQELL